MNIDAVANLSDTQIYELYDDIMETKIGDFNSNYCYFYCSGCGNGVYAYGYHYSDCSGLYNNLLQCQQGHKYNVSGGCGSKSWGYCNSCIRT